MSGFLRVCFCVLVGWLEPLGLRYNAEPHCVSVQCGYTQENLWYVIDYMVTGKVPSSSGIDQHWCHIIGKSLPYCKASYCSWTGVFWPKSSSPVPIFPLCCTSQFYVSVHPPACVTVRVSEWSGYSLLQDSDCKMSPLNMLMFWIPMVPLGENLTLLDRCVCVCL